MKKPEKKEEKKKSGKKKDGSKEDLLPLLTEKLEKELKKRLKLAVKEIKKDTKKEIKKIMQEARQKLKLKAEVIMQDLLKSTNLEEKDNALSEPEQHSIGTKLIVDDVKSEHSPAAPETLQKEASIDNSIDSIPKPANSQSRRKKTPPGLDGTKPTRNRKPVTSKATMPDNEKAIENV